MPRANKIVRQESWLRQKAAKGKQQIQDRRERRRVEEKNPALKAKRLANNKPQTLEDKRVYPSSEDYYSRRKRRRVAEEGTEEDETEGKDDEPEVEEAEGAEMEVERNEDDDLASLLGDSDDDEEDKDAGLTRKERREKHLAEQEEKRKADEAQAAADEAEKRIAHEDRMAAKYTSLLPSDGADEEDEVEEGQPGKVGGSLEQPRLLITTSRHATIHRYAETLCDLFPNSTYIPRSGHHHTHHEYSVREIASYAHNRGYTALLILNEDQKKPSGLDITLLPDGPMLHFSVQTWVDAKRLPNHGRSTGHVPEVLMNNFDTPLGKLVGSVLGRLFPKAPELVGRTVVTLHNQRDFVFVRRHRYMMREKRETERSVTEKDGKKMTGVEDLRVALQEIGPRMTLKLRRVDKGLQRTSGQAFEWTGRMEKKRTVFQL
ncbi:rna processing factor 1 [Ophiostoma piceae UAMH 11346]|uniref:Rna processing factor 1 n=1 Tax=Ophiostoma piceae (strain UAMH 11346) TaxID=1262450 RepID=S3BZ58_OPHP1|nr:rna processing factor 1 [Ophiostoma piceae UAMH 11346]